MIDLFSIDTQRTETLAEWLALEPPHAAPFERALWYGAVADRLGWALAGGYQSALARLTGEVDRWSFAATEAGGAHPKAMATRLEGGVLRGEKTFATMATVARAILVVATAESGKLCVARIRPDAPGVSIAERPATPFTPELPHAKVTLADVTPDEVLPGDGYDLYVKPFRTVEDVHVLAAALAFLRKYRPEEPEILTHLAALEAVAALPPLAPEAHIALAGTFQAVRRWSDAVPAPFWERDRAVLMVAEGIRSRRTAKAWETLRSRCTSAGSP